jgi:uncharacterized protein YbjQ (UPF0145 family)
LEAIVGLLCNCGLPLFLAALGLVVGKSVEYSHLRSLAQREEALRSMIATNLRRAPAGHPATSGVSGSVVIGSDYFKTLVAGLKKLIGGEIRSYERMLERARREALCRMLESARAQGATTVVNVRYETSSIGGIGSKSPPMAEVVAYGTALIG